MKCPKCGSANVECFLKKGRIIRKTPPLWVGIVSILSSFILILEIAPILSMETLDISIKVLIAMLILITLYGGIIYLIAWGIIRSKEKEIKFVEAKCKDCNNEFLEKLS